MASLTLAALITGACSRTAGSGASTDALAQALAAVDPDTPLPFPFTVPRLTLVPDLRIDGEKEDLSEFPYGFLLVMPSGTMAFAEWQDFRIRFYDSTGRHLGNYGRKGMGPGEFAAVSWRGGQRANFDGGIVGDSLWLYDAPARRLTIITSGREFVRTTLLEGSVLGDAARLRGVTRDAMLANGDFIATATYTDGSGSGGRGTGPGSDNRIDLVRINSRGASVRELVTTSFTRPSLEIRDSRGQTRKFTVPYTGMSLRAIAGDGNRVAIAVTGPVSDSAWSFVITVVSADGDTLLQRDIPTEGEPLDSRELDRFLRELSGDLAAEVGGKPWHDADAIDDLMRRMREAAPRTVSPISAMRIGLDNSIWLFVRGVDATRGVLILDERGEPAGELVYPAAAGSIRQVSRRYVWAMTSDQDGFPSIVRYRIEPVR